MPSEISIELYPVMPTRPCSFCLCLQDAAVFADFDIVSERHVRLIRISYEGYGCCRAENLPTIISSGASILLSAIANESLNSPDVKNALREYFREIADLIWRDALEEHGLL